MSMVPDGRILALDVGSVRIGVAVSDPLGIIGQPFKVITCSSQEKDIAAIREIVEGTQAVRIVVGLPLNLEGKPGPQANRVLEFVEVLRQAVAVEVVTMDERYTTAGAERFLISANVRRKKRKQIVDKIAAQQILQTYLDRLRRTSQKPSE